MRRQEASRARRRVGDLLRLLLLGLAVLAGIAAAEPTEDRAGPSDRFGWRGEARSEPSRKPPRDVGLPEDAPASRLAPDAGVHYYTYIRFRPAGSDSFAEGCATGSRDVSLPEAGDYAFQILVLPAAEWHTNGTSPREPYSRLQAPWGAVRGRLTIGGFRDALVRARSPLVEPARGSAPPNALRVSPDHNLWGLDAQGRHTFHDALAHLQSLVRLGAGGAAPASQADQELALLRALCGSSTGQAAFNEDARLLRLDRALAQGLDWLDLPPADDPEAAAAPTPALAALSLFVAPDEPIAPSLDALLERIKDDAAFTRAGYLQGEPHADYKQLFDAFRERLQALSAEAADLAEERRSNAADAERREQLIAECRTGLERACQSDCLEFLTDEQRKDCPRADVSGRTGSQGDGGPGGSKLGVLLLALLALALAALLAFLVFLFLFLFLARRAEPKPDAEDREPHDAGRASFLEHDAESGAPEHNSRASFLKRLPGLMQSDDKRSRRDRRERSAPAMEPPAASRPIPNALHATATDRPPEGCGNQPRPERPSVRSASQPAAAGAPVARLNPPSTRPSPETPPPAELDALHEERAALRLRLPQVEGQDTGRPAIDPTLAPHGQLDDLPNDLSALSARPPRVEDRTQDPPPAIDDAKLTDHVRRLIAEMQPGEDQLRTVRSDVEHRLQGLKDDFLAGLNRDQKQMALAFNRMLAQTAERLDALETDLKRSRRGAATEAALREALDAHAGERAAQQEALLTQRQRFADIAARLRAAPGARAATTATAPAATVPPSALPATADSPVPAEAASAAAGTGTNDALDLHARETQPGTSSEPAPTPRTRGRAEPPASVTRGSAAAIAAKAGHLDLDLDFADLEALVPHKTPRGRPDAAADGGGMSPAARRLRDGLQHTLETHKVFQPEGWDELWEGFSEQRPDQFLKQLMDLYLPDNLSERALEEIDTCLADAFGGRASLIRPRPGHSLDPTAHRAVSTVPRTTGAFNIVHALIRPGARCDGRVVRQAQVVRAA
jgi:hypothetical protein